MSARTTELGREQVQTIEPMIKFNGSGYGIKWTTLLQLLMILGGGLVAFSTMQGQLSSLEKSVETLSAVVETARRERNDHIKSLEHRVSSNETERARLAEQVHNLDRLIEDIRDLLRAQAEKG